MALMAIKPRIGMSDKSAPPSLLRIHDHAIFPRDAAAYSIVAMAAFFTAIIRSPLTGVGLKIA
jgi:hypothetical protein